MKNTESLQRSYEKQRQIFEESKAKKLRNLEIQAALIKEKQEKLSQQLQIVLEQEMEVKKKDYQSFDNFQNTARSRSEKSILPTKAP